MPRNKGIGKARKMGSHSFYDKRLKEQKKQQKETKMLIMEMASLAEVIDRKNSALQDKIDDNAALEWERDDARRERDEYRTKYDAAMENGLGLEIKLKSLHYVHGQKSRKREHAVAIEAEESSDNLDAGKKKYRYRESKTTLSRVHGGEEGFKHYISDVATRTKEMRQVQCFFYFVLWKHSENLNI